ncbi:unnamed protein product, partial [Laminaria digitata]
MDAPIQTAHPRIQHAIQDPHRRMGRELSTDRRKTDCNFLRETAAATCATAIASTWWRPWHGGTEELLIVRSTRRCRRRHSERVCGLLVRGMTKMQKKLTSLSFGVLVCWWSNFTGSINAAVGATVSVGFGGGCPSACSGHGYCTNPSTETCSCHQGWAGGDCSIRK